jgi:hypothetical protein
MNFLITESQLKFLVEGIGNPRVVESLRKMNSFTNRMVNKVGKKYGLNLRLLSTWGPAVGGLVMPLDNFIKTGDFTLDENQAALILCGTAATLFFDNKPLIKELILKIKEEGIEDAFKKVLRKGKDLKYAFTTFIESLNVTINSASEILSYAFLLPIIPDIQGVISRSADIGKTAILIGERMGASGLILISSAALISLLNKILKRLS